MEMSKRAGLQGKAARVGFSLLFLEPQLTT